MLAHIALGKSKRQLEGNVLSKTHLRDWEDGSVGKLLLV